MQAAEFVIDYSRNTMTQKKELKLLSVASFCSQARDEEGENHISHISHISYFNHATLQIKTNTNE